jgi:hypothetical protein
MGRARGGHAENKLLLGYMQTAWPLERKPVPLPEGPGRVADHRPVHSDLQRGAVGGALHRAGRAVDRLAARQDQDLRARRRPPRRVPRVLRRGRRDPRHARQQPHAKAGNINAALKNTTASSSHLRLRPHSHALVHADRHGLVRARRQAGHGAAAALFLLGRPVRAQPRHLRHGAERRRAVLRPDPGRQRPLERHLLLRLVRGAAPDHRGRSGRHRGRDRDRRRPHRAEDAPPRLQHRLPGAAASGRPGHRKPVGPRRPAHSLGARHGADLPHRQPAVRARPALGPAPVLRQRDAALLVRPAAASST